MDARRRLTPWMADYDRLEVVWLPYVMFFHGAGQKLGALNLDSYGIRRSVAPDGRPVSLDDPPRGPVNILIGNSTAFGVGATGDDATIASQLAARTGEDWLNLSGRAFTTTQELIQFQLHLDRLGPVKRIVVFSGAVNLVLHHRSPDYPRAHGPFFFWRQYDRLMRDEALTVNRRRLKGLLGGVYGDRIDWARVPLTALPARLLGLARDPLPPSSRPGGDQLREIDDAYAQLARDLRLWRVLARGLNAELHMVFQPLAHWTDKAATPEEQDLYAHFDAQPRKFHQVLGKVLTREHHAPAAAALAAACARHEVDWLDMNAEFSHRKLDGRWIFSDRIHLTDEGYDLAARIIAERFTPSA